MFPALPGLSPLTYPNSPCRVVVLDKVTDLLLLFGKLLVVGGVGKDQGMSFKDRGQGCWEAEDVTLEECH